MEKDIENCLKVLEAGGIILYPTDTVWGLGCDATNPDAVAALYALKRRRDSKSMLSLVDSRESLLRWVGELPENAEATLAEAILAEPGRPTTVIYPSPRGLAPGLIAEDGSAGFRISGEAFTRELCRRFGRPVVSTSANISGEPPAARFPEVSPEILRAVDYAVNYRRDDMEEKSPSRILKISPEGTLTIIRP